jgi:hypothetical protein
VKLVGAIGVASVEILMKTFRTIAIFKRPGFRDALGADFSLQSIACSLSAMDRTAANPRLL